MTSRASNSTPVDPELDRAEWARVRSWSQSTLDELDDPPHSDFDRERKEAVRENLAASRQLVAELQALGIPLQRLGELSNVRITYPQAAPVLLAHLDKSYPEGVRGSILQALAQPYGDPYGRLVFESLRDTLRRNAASLSEHERDQYTFAIAANATKANTADLVAMIGDSALGHARIPIVLRAARWRDDRIAKAVRDLFREGSLEWAALRSLRLAKIWDVRDEVRPYLTHRDPDFRAEARSYFRALNKA